MEEPSKLRKYYILTLAILMIIIFLTYLTIEIGILNQLVAYKIENNKVTYKDKSIEFTNNTYNEILKTYLEQQPNEIKLCLMGNIKNNKYTITEVIKPKIINQEFSKVESIPCPKETLIDLHSHPRKSCIFSEQDIKSYNINKINNKKLIMGLLCDDNKLNFYT